MLAFVWWRAILREIERGGLRFVLCGVGGVWKKPIVLALMAGLLVVACAQKSPRDAMLDASINAARVELAQGKPYSALKTLRNNFSANTREDIAQFGRELVSSINLTQDVLQDFRSDPSGHVADAGLTLVRNLKLAGIITAEQAERAERDLGQAVAAAVASGATAEVLLDDEVARLAPMQTDAVRAALFRNTVSGRLNSRRSSMLVKVALDTRKGSPERRLLQQNLSRLVIDSKTMPDLEKMFPKYVAELRDHREVLVAVRSADRLVRDDLEKTFKRDRNVRIVDESHAEVIIDIERLQWTLSPPNESVQTVQYASYNVNILASTLLMPRNATYVYELRTGNASLQYAFELKVQDRENKKVVFDDLIRGRESTSWHQCINPRIVNVFGGTQPASFMANAHMQQICGGSSSAPQQGAMERTAYGKLYRRIIAMQPFVRARERLR